MILVLTGTHHQGFDRLVEAAGRLAASGERVVVQAGTSSAQPAGCEVFGMVTPEEVARLADAAAVVVTHAGPASVHLAWERGLTPVVVPREAARGEHVDDHQGRWAETLGERAVVVHDLSQLPAAVAAARARPRGPRRSPEALPTFVDAFGEAIDEVVARPREGPRATLGRLLLHLGRPHR